MTRRRPRMARSSPRPSSPRESTPRTAGTPRGRRRSSWTRLDRYHRTDDRAALQGRGWAFLNLAALYGKTARLDLAFVTFTKAQDVLGAAEDWAGVAAAWEAQAQLRRAIQDEDRWRDDLAEAVVFYDRAAMKEKADRLRGLLGRRLV